MNIGIEAIKNKTTKEVLEMEEKVKKFPEGFKFTYQKPEKSENYAEQLVKELKKQK